MKRFWSSHLLPLLLVTLAWGGGFHGKASAHSRALGKAELRLEHSGAGQLDIILTREDVEEFFEVDLQVADDHPRLRMLSQDRFPNYIRIFADDMRCRLQAPASMPPSGARMVFVLPLQCPHVPEILQVDWGLSGLADFDLQVALTLHPPSGPAQQAALARQLTRARFRLRSPDRWQTLWTYWHLGWSHIGEGWDHLAFLLALLLQVFTFRQLMLWVTTFTVAHAVTLTLSLWSWVAIAPAIVEPAIAVTIVVAALHALWLQRQPPHAPTGAEGEMRVPAGVGKGFWLRGTLVIFGIGLIHGLGFSTLLKETLQSALLLSTSPVRTPSPSDPDLLTSLLGFHLGIECGQVVWVALLYPVLRWMRNAPVGTRLLPVLAACVAGAGLWFLAQATGWGP